MSTKISVSELGSAKKLDAVVVFSFSNTDDKKNKKTDKDKRPGVTVLSPFGAVQKKIKQAALDKTFSAKPGELILFRDSDLDGHRHTLVIGLGSKNEANRESLRRAGAAAIKKVQSLNAKKVGIVLSHQLPAQLKDEAAAEALTEGILLGEYTTKSLKGKNAKDKEETLNCLIVVTGKGGSAKAKAGVKTGTIVSECVNFSRKLGDYPGNLMNPSILARETQAAARGTGLRVTVWDKARIKREKMGMLYGVSLGSSQDPRLIVMQYNGAAKSQKPICFVGKGLTFDSGGISIKPSPSMEEMKFDMCGGANVIGTMLAIAKLKLKINVLGVVPASENMPGPSANKPGDILTARNGKTVEVNNTDAEGRLILGDALVWASEQKPSVIVDAATLTGAMVMALGDTHTGFFCRDSHLTKILNEASEKADERVWHMPLVDEHVDNMKGTYADLSNMSKTRGAGSAAGAAFLEQFIENKVPWAHFDIAGTAWNIGHRYPYHPAKGASGVMIRTFLKFAQIWKS